ncbi:hypothetical protein JHK87_035389 [Glycine soja]|nr:hypothetical protein JHK87_035389 [Glycine soja]
MSAAKNSKDLGTLEPPADLVECAIQYSSLPLISLPFCGFHLVLSQLTKRSIFMFWILGFRFKSIVMACGYVSITARFSHLGFSPIEKNRSLYTKFV